jgi:hypothetical protein
MKESTQKEERDRLVLIALNYETMAHEAKVLATVFEMAALLSKAALDARKTQHILGGRKVTPDVRARYRHDRAKLKEAVFFKKAALRQAKLAREAAVKAGASHYRGTLFS